MYVVSKSPVFGTSIISMATLEKDIIEPDVVRSKKEKKTIQRTSLLQFPVPSTPTSVFIFFTTRITKRACCQQTVSTTRM